MISRFEFDKAWSIRQRVVAEGGYMFHERKADGSYRHGFEKYVNGEFVHTFSPALMSDIRMNKVALHKLGEWMCRKDPRGVGSSTEPSRQPRTREGDGKSECNAETRV
jgi:hypothetical protein